MRHKFVFCICTYLLNGLCEFVLISSWLHNDLQVAMIGPKLDLTYDYEVSVIENLFCTMIFFVSGYLITVSWTCKG